MTHDPDHDLRALNPGAQNGLSDRRLDQTYHAAQHDPDAEQEPWELRGTERHSARRPTRPRRVGKTATTRLVIALLLVIALVVALVGRW